MRRIAVFVAAFLLGGAAFAVEKDLVKFGGDVTVSSGTTVRDAVAMGGSVYVNGRVDRNAVAIGGRVVLGPGAVVENDVVSLGGTASLGEGSMVGGKLVDMSPSSIFRGGGERWSAVRGMLRFVHFVGFLALALFIAALFPRALQAVAGMIEHQPGISLLAAIAGTLLIVPVGLLLVVSIAGILLVPFEILFVLAAFLFGYIAAAAVTGSRILAAVGLPRVPLLPATLAGVTVLWLLGFIPFFGWLVTWAASLLGYGGVLAALLRVRRPPSTPAGPTQP